LVCLVDWVFGCFICSVFWLVCSGCGWVWRGWGFLVGCSFDDNASALSVVPIFLEGCLCNNIFPMRLLSQPASFPFQSRGIDLQLTQQDSLSSAQHLDDNPPVRYSGCAHLSHFRLFHRSAPSLDPPLWVPQNVFIFGKAAMVLSGVFSPEP